SLLSPRFNNATNIENILSGYSFMAILAIGESLPILTRGIDLSVGSTVALGGMILFDLSMILGLPGYIAVPAAILATTLAGVVNGLLITRLRLQPFVATLATLAAYRGSVYAISGRQLYPELGTKAIRDPWLLGVETYFDVGGATHLDRLFGFPFIPLSFFMMLAVLVATQIVLSRTRFGLDLKTVGGNPEAARLAGIRVDRTIVAAYALSGFCAGLAAVILVARMTTSTEALGTGMELTAISAAVIGGVSLQGGVGSASGPALGAFLLGVILIGLTLAGFSQYVQQIITGTILIGAVWYDRVLSQRRRRVAERLQGGEHASIA
ncbi:MAG TPA: ABC transporter permease, partial [Candidatus Methylomirabilis sp.]|nr:ABC transporter permease [Candidatus Methylomirabilis sp.]